jgi:hypothetical protein
LLVFLMLGMLGGITPPTASASVGRLPTAASEKQPEHGCNYDHPQDRVHHDAQDCSD